MAKLYVQGKTVHKVNTRDICCPHLHTGAVADRYTTEVDVEVRTYYTCRSCHDKLTENIAKQFVFCNDCGKRLKPEKSNRWEASSVDVSFHLCDDCVCAPRHLNRMELSGKI
ncbi:MAG: hypothetical protein ACRDBQ_18830 [Shewanella sp.]